jgi:CBS domain-containing protein
MKIKELLTGKNGDIYQVTPDDLVHDSIKIMNTHRIGSVLVVDGSGNLAGILTERDLLMGFPCCDNAPGVCKRQVAEIMTPADRLITVTGESSIDEACAKMTENKVRHLPVLDEAGRLSGIISIGDVLKKLLHYAEQENKTMKQYMFGQDQLFAVDEVPMV